MKHILLPGLIALCLMIGLSSVAIAQPSVTVEPSYDVQLHLIIGSNDTTTPKGDLPAALSGLSRQIKGAMPYSNYRLASTFLGRLSNNGNFEYKSLSNLFGPEVDLRSQSFLEWSITQVRNLPTLKGGQGYQAASFRFGAKVPVLMGMGKDDTGKPTPVTGYENIGLNLSRIGVADSVPTLVGTLSLPGSNGTIFLVMTVKPAEL